MQDRLFEICQKIKYQIELLSQENEKRYLSHFLEDSER